MKTRIPIFLLLLWFLVPQLLPAQGWERIYKEGLSANTHDLIPTLDGGFLMSGSVKTSVNGGRQILLLKTDADGHVQWRRSIDTNYDQVGVSVVQTPANEYYLIGHFQTLDNADTDLTLIKLDAAGQVLWQRFFDEELDQQAKRIRLHPDGTIWVLASTIIDDNGQLQERSRLLRFLQTGILLNAYTIGAAYDRPVDLSIASDGNLVVLSDQGLTSSNFEDDLVLRKLNGNGIELWENTYGGPFGEHAGALIQTADGGFAMTAYLYGGNHQHEDKGVLLFKTDSDGVLQWQKHYVHFPAAPGWLSRPGIGRDLKQATDGGFLISGATFDYPPFDAFLIRTQADGTERWRRLYRGGEDYSAAFNRMLSLGENGYLMTGQINSGQPNGWWLLKADTLGRTLSAYLEGVAVWDENADCAASVWERPLSDWKVRLSGPDERLLSVGQGIYGADVDTLPYAVELIPPSPYWDACPPQLVNITQLYDTTLSQLAADPVYDCPQLSVNIGAANLVQCETTAYTIAYCNKGTTVAEGVYIELLIDPDLTVDSTSIPIDDQLDQLYTFLLNDVAAGECGQFQLYATLNCDAISGATHCLEAHIYPDSICLPPDAAWSGASIELEVDCKGDSLQLGIYNNGLGDMLASHNFIIIEDDVILRTEPFDLPAGQSILLNELPAGATIRLQVPQVTGHPGNSHPTVVFEGCGGPPISTGFVDQFAEDDEDDFVDVHCIQNRIDQAKNGLLAYPEGYGTEHLIDSGRELEYLLYFQNERSDTVHRLVIRDTLSPLLDIESLRVGVSSHPFRLVLQNDSIFQLIFDDIDLPPASANELASRGFVKFNIGQAAGNGVGDVIFHQASLYFDFEAPFQTAETFHTIGKDYINQKTVSIDQTTRKLPAIQIRPNPMYDKALFDLSGVEGAVKLTLYDIGGRELLQKRFPQSRFTFLRNHLTSG
ncbi:MAG: hypothetical protein AAF990_23725, partial [Bacteroidota bacterium]